MFINLLLIIPLLLVFISVNLLFHLFYELVLLLTFYLIVKWKYSENHWLSGLCLIFYIIIFLLSILYIIYSINWNNCRLNFILIEILNLNLNLILFIYLLISFLIKIPIYVFYDWLLNARVEALYYLSITFQLYWN